MLLKKIIKTFCITAICTCCTGIAGLNDNNTQSGNDSITFLLKESSLLPDTMAQTAITYLERALQLSIQKNSDKDTRFEIFYNLGVQSKKTGNYDLAISYFEEAVKIASRKNIASKGNAFNHLGQIALLQGKYDKAIDYFPEALNIRIQLDDIEGQASSYRNIGTAYQKGGNYEQALEQYEHSLNLYGSLKNEMGKADCFINLGGLYLEQNKPQQALKYYLETEKIYNDAGNGEQLWNVYYNIGYTYHLMNEIENARNYYHKMLQLSRSLSSKAILAETYSTLGTFYEDDDILKQDSAIFYYSKAIEIANSSKLYELLQYALEQRSRLYAVERRYSEAYYDLMAYNYAYDEVNNKENIRAFTQKSEHYKFEMLQKEQLFKNRIQRIFIIALSVVMLLVGAMGVVSYRAFVQKKKDHILLKKQHVMLEKQKEEITDSIRYAGLIQTATLPAKEYSDSVLPEHFIYYKPRDIVSGDFYWIDHTDNRIIVAVADCTGHGVPGAIVSMLGISSLNKIVSKIENPKADYILNELRKEIIRLLNPVGAADERKDGMDIALVIIHTDSHEMEFSGAYNPLYLIRNGELIEKKANRMPIGLYVKQDEQFTAEHFDYKIGDTIYLFSDGYSDQFGGAEGVKFKSKNFKNLLLEINKLSMKEQVQIIDKTHIEWRGKTPQIDDVSVVGIRL